MARMKFIKLEDEQSKSGKQSITLKETFVGTVRVHLDGGLRKFKAGETIERGDVPDQVFDSFAKLPCFGATREEYRGTKTQELEVPKSVSEDPPQESTPSEAEDTLIDGEE